LILDADEILTEELKAEIYNAVHSSEFDGYWLRYQIYFLGRLLRFGDTQLWKLALFKHGAGRYETRLRDQDHSMGDMEVHEHIVLDAPVGRLRGAVRHENMNSLDRYIAKHNEYSNWEAAVLSNRDQSELRPAFWGTQAERRRFLKQSLLRIPGSSVLYFVYLFIFRLGFLDGSPGLIHAAFKGIQTFHTKAKIFERRCLDATR
jgi:hypothetical protein